MTLLRTILAAFFSAVLVSALPAQSWTGGGANALWSTGGNWSGGTPVSGSGATVTFGAFATANLAPNQDLANPFTLNAMSFTGSSAFALTGNAISFTGGTRTLQSSATADISIANALTWTGNGTISTGANLLTLGNVTLTEGTLTIGSNNVVVNSLTLNDGIATGAAVVNTGAFTLRLGGNVQYTGDAGFISEPAEILGRLDVNNGTRTFSVANPSSGDIYDLIIRAPIVGTGGVNFGAVGQPGNLLIMGANTYTGATTVHTETGAANFIGLTNALPTTTALTLSGAGQFLLTTIDQPGNGITDASYNQTVGSLASSTASAWIVFGATSSLTVGTDNTNTTYAGFFTQRAAGLTAQFIKTGTGTLTLSGNVAQNAPSGGTQGFRGVVTIQQGTLLANATAGATGGIAHSSTGRGTVTVQNGATLGGTGAVVPTLGSQAANVIAINSGGTVAPGNGGTNIGTLRFGYDDGTVVSRSTVNMNGRLLIDLTTVSNDQLAIRGALNLSGTSVLEASGITSVPGGGSTLTFTIATFDSLSGTFNPANLILPTGSTVQYNANSIQLLVPVPEPGSMIVMGMSAIGASAGWRRWRRRAI